MRKQRRARSIVAVVLLLLALWLWTELFGGEDGQDPSAYAAPLAQAGGPTPRASCGPCPNTLYAGGVWDLVKQYLAWSGCEDWLCWSKWVYNDPSNALMEMTSHRLPLRRGIPNPLGWPQPGKKGDPVPWPNSQVWDGRQKCATGEYANGIWYHNAHAKPSWQEFWDGAELLMACNWEMDLSRQTWNFAEDDECPLPCVTATPPPWPTPYVPVTVCPENTPIHEPTKPPPTPTPFAAIPPQIEAEAYVHSRLDPNDDAYLYGPKFFWPWQHFLNTSLTAKITEPSVPGCGSSSRVAAYWFLGSGDEVVCKDRSDDPLNCRWRRPYTGGAHPDVSSEEWIHLLWAWGETPVTQPATWTFSGVGPVWVDISYSVIVVTTYTCGEMEYTVFWPKELSLEVGLVRTVRTP